MAGHSQFKNIMHRKGAQDKKRSKIFAKLGREITVATKMGQPDPAMNPRLRGAILAARSANMPNSRIKSAIEQGDPNNSDAANYEEVRYEGYGPGGTAVIVEGLTDNRNRAASDIRLCYAKNGGNLGEENSVSFMFDKIGSIVYPETVATSDEIFEIAVEAGADDIEASDGNYDVITQIPDFVAVRDVLEKKFGEPASAAIVWKPKSTIPLDEDQAKTMLKLIDVLEDNDDVQNVFSNFEIDDAVMEKLLEA